MHNSSHRASAGIRRREGAVVIVVPLALRVDGPDARNADAKRRGWLQTVWMDETTLYRLVGQRELDLIAASGWRRFPPRLDWQPIFYPVLNEAYAVRIAREWNTRDADNGNVGYVLRFDVDSAYLKRFDVQQVGDAECLELWIPAEELDNFNDHIRGVIKVASEWREAP